jgi:hypothetical protein
VVGVEASEEIGLLGVLADNLGPAEHAVIVPVQPVECIAASVPLRALDAGRCC